MCVSVHVHTYTCTPANTCETYMVAVKVRGRRLTGISWGLTMLGIDTSNSSWNFLPLPYGSFSGFLVCSVPIVPKKDSFFEPVYFQNLILGDLPLPGSKTEFSQYAWLLQYLYMLASSHQTTNLNKDVFLAFLDTLFNSLQHYFSPKSVRRPWGLGMVSNETSSQQLMFCSQTGTNLPLEIYLQLFFLELRL